MNTDGIGSNRGPWAWAAMAVLVTAASVGPYLQGASYPFLHDDRWAVVANPLVQETPDIPRILMSDAWGGSIEHGHIVNYRPLSVLTLSITRELAGPDPFPYRVTNILLHAACTLLLLVLMARLGLGPLAAGAAGLWFAVHPVHVETVAFAVNREEMLAQIFFLLVMLQLVRHTRIAAQAPPRPWSPAELLLLAFLAACGFMSKETAVVTPVVFVIAAVAWASPGKRRWAIAPATILALVTMSYLALRRIALGRVSARHIPWQDNPLVRSDGLDRIAGAFEVLWESARLLAVPDRLTVDYGFDVLGIPSGGISLRAILGLSVAAAATILALVAARRAPVVSLGILIAAASYGLVSHFAFPGSILMAERLLMLPSTGIAIALGACVQALPRHGLRHFATASLALLALSLLPATLERASDHRSAEALFASSIANRPGSTRLLNNLGVEYLDAGRFAEAEPMFAKALAIDAKNAEAHNNMGMVQERMGQPGKAFASFMQALEIRPGMPTALGNLCLHLARKGDFDRARVACDYAVKRGAPVREVLEQLPEPGPTTPDSTPEQ